MANPAVIRSSMQFYEISGSFTTRAFPVSQQAVAEVLKGKKTFFSGYQMIPNGYDGISYSRTGIPLTCEDAHFRLPRIAYEIGKDRPTPITMQKEGGVALYTGLRGFLNWLFGSAIYVGGKYYNKEEVCNLIGRMHMLKHSDQTCMTTRIFHKRVPTLMVEKSLKDRINTAVDAVINRGQPITTLNDLIANVNIEDREIDSTIDINEGSIQWDRQNTTDEVVDLSTDFDDLYNHV